MEEPVIPGSSWFVMNHLLIVYVFYSVFSGNNNSKNKKLLTIEGSMQ